MQYILTPYADKMPPWAWWDNTFTPEELDWLQQKAKDADRRARTGGDGYSEEQLLNIRRSKVSWLENDESTVWVFKKLAHVTSSLNSQYFRFDLTGFGEAIQLTNYDHSEHGMYGWHQDYNTGTLSRKLSLVLQLTDPSEYEGGNLQILIDGNPMTIEKKRGFLVAFPSYIVHQVTPVTNGSRQSLVSWVTGPAFK